MANKIRRRTRTDCSAFGTNLASIVRLDSNNFNAFSFSFVLDEALQLIEAPVTVALNKAYCFKKIADLAINQTERCIELTQRCIELNI